MSARGARGRASYGRKRPEVFGGLVARVDEGAPAARAGLAAGDLVVEAGGFPIDDEIDWRWHADGASVRVMLADGRTLTLERDPGEPWGLAFADPLFDGIHTCANDCAFCFMSQLPAGMRPSLYVRDDDFRLSFLQGNFITLTNLRDRDVHRIVEQALSPLYVSLHAVEPEVREWLVRCRNDQALERFDELVEGGIHMHVQIVLVPGINDGEHLERTLTWLAEREGVVSVGIVPVGRTTLQTEFEGSFDDAAEVAPVIARVERWQQAMRDRDRVSWVHLADEFYLNSGTELPPASEYDGFPQLENGIGMVRSFLDGWEALGAPDPSAEPRYTLVTGSMFASTLRDLVPHAHILAVRNRFFGGNVGVAGLLTGTDVVKAIRAHGGRRYALPDAVLNVDGVTLDDMTPEDIAREAEAAVTVVESSPAGLAAALQLGPPAT